MDLGIPDRSSTVELNTSVHQAFFNETVGRETVKVVFTPDSFRMDRLDTTKYGTGERHTVGVHAVGTTE
ncbi:MAG: hypothetical protein JWM68_403 [Verrucomicrobiales bacterium]|nr:hypothetical protein [Verrucomicrobiales bacterium]